MRDRVRSESPWVLLLLGCAVLCAVFGGYELLERFLLLRTTAPTQLDLFHILRGIFAAIALATVVAWYVRRSPDSVFPSPPARQGLPVILDREERLRQHVRWFVGMRWIAAGATLALVLIAVPIAAILPSGALPPLVGWSIALMAGNATFVFLQRSPADAERQLVVQASFDLVVLTGLLNASGGLENPLVILYIVHVIIAHIVLPRGPAFALAAIAAALLVGLAVGELAGVLPHYPNRLFPHFQAVQRPGVGEHAMGAFSGGGPQAFDDPVFVAGRTLSLLALMFLTAYLTGILSERLRHSEHELEALARSAILDRNRLEGIVHSAGLGILLVARDLSVVWIDSHASEWLGWEARRVGHACPRAGIEGGCEDCLAQRTV